MKFREKVEEKVYDERTQKISQNGLAICGVISIFYVIGRIIYMGFVKDRLALPEIILLLVFCAVLSFNDLKNNNFDFSEYDKKYDTSPTKEGKRNRFKRYALHSLVFAFAFATMDIIFLGDIFSKKIWLEGIITFVSMYATSFIIDSLVGEHKVKKYNKFMDSLEDDEQD